MNTSDKPAAQAHLTPLSKLDPALRKNIRGVAFDVDDTLTRDAVLEGKALTALYRAARAGFQLAAVTGRPLGWADVLAQLLPIHLAVGENGAGWVYREGHSLLRGYHHDEQERGDQQQRLQRCLDAVRQHFPDIKLASDQLARRCDLAFSVGEDAPLKRPQIDELRRLIDDHGLKTAESSVHVHAIAGHWNKVEGLRRGWKARTGTPLNPEQWAFIGDSPNDQEAFAYFPVSVGVANVQTHLDHLKHPPRYVTNDSHGKGFAELIDFLVAD